MSSQGAPRFAQGAASGIPGKHYRVKPSNGEHGQRTRALSVVEVSRSRPLALKSSALTKSGSASAQLAPGTTGPAVLAPRWRQGRNPKLLCAVGLQKTSSWMEVLKNTDAFDGCGGTGCFNRAAAAGHWGFSRCLANFPQRKSSQLARHTMAGTNGSQDSNISNVPLERERAHALAQCMPPAVQTAPVSPSSVQVGLRIAKPRPGTTMAATGRRGVFVCAGARTWGAGRWHPQPLPPWTVSL